LQINLSNKERMLLEDQIKHELICIEKYSNYANLASDPQLKQIFQANEASERSHLDSINQLLSGTLPQMNQQQQNQQAQSGLTNTPATSLNISDKDLCEDLLMTEKYVSGTYDTAIFECKDTNVRDTLNHIQKEEQKHGEAIFQYMNSKGMYGAQ
jgi:spore coat protein CotF